VCSKTTANDHHHLSLIFSGDDDLWYNKTHKLAFGEFVILILYIEHVGVKNKYFFVSKATYRVKKVTPVMIN